MRFWKFLSLSLAVLVVALQLRLWLGQGSITELVDLEQQLSQFRETNAELRERNERLVVEVEEFRSGLDSVEEMAREELGMIRRGETFYVIVDR
jgi:cell division protein FtsB